MRSHKAHFCIIQSTIIKREIYGILNSFLFFSFLEIRYKLWVASILGIPYFLAFQFHCRFTYFSFQWCRLKRFPFKQWKGFRFCLESLQELKAYQNPFAGFKWVRNQHPAIGHTFKKIKNSQGHQITAWIQQRHFQLAPLMRHPEPPLQTPDKDDSVLSVPPRSNGNILSPHDYHSN